MLKIGQNGIANFILDRIFKYRILEQNKKITKSKKQSVQKKRKVNLLVDIAAKMEQGKGKGYEYWAKIFNLKEIAKTLNFLTEKGISDYEVLVKKSDEIESRFNKISVQLKVMKVV